MRLIDADVLMEQLNRKKSEVAKARYTDGFNDAILRVRSMVHSAPTFDAERVKHGHWEYGGLVWHCSECGKNPTYGMGFTQGKNNLFNYCPNCGAKMDEVSE